MNKILEQQTLIKEDIRMANKHMARCSTSLVIQEMQIKTTVRYHSTSIRTAISKNQKSHQKYQVLIRIRSTAFFTHCWWDVKWRGLSRKQFLIRLNMPLPYDPATYSWALTLEKWRLHPKICMWILQQSHSWLLKPRNNSYVSKQVNR